LEADRRNADPKAASNIPGESQIQIGLARAHLGLKQYAEAWKSLEATRILNANDPDVYTYRGAYYLQQDKIKQAVRELEKAMRMEGIGRIGCRVFAASSGVALLV